MVIIRRGKFEHRVKAKGRERQTLKDISLREHLGFNETPGKTDVKEITLP